MHAAVTGRWGGVVCLLHSPFPAWGAGDGAEAQHVHMQLGNSGRGPILRNGTRGPLTDAGNTSSRPGLKVRIPWVPLHPAFDSSAASHRLVFGQRVLSSLAKLV